MTTDTIRTIIFGRNTLLLRTTYCIMGTDIPNCSTLLSSSTWSPKERTSQSSPTSSTRASEPLDHSPLVFFQKHFAYYRIVSDSGNLIAIFFRLSLILSVHRVHFLAEFLAFLGYRFVPVRIAATFGQSWFPFNDNNMLLVAEVYCFSTRGFFSFIFG
ncbi:hypothetical protein AYI70_g293 [Smittium culicis]|uniref:Uncharacterized protein n=1 Tax=Smittium culicis TaxID=133412 RepID=A0A1R1YHB3_9FUNG|nr:hypothetical protein AYI70_g293 [Smittium culicis]